MLSYFNLSRSVKWYIYDTPLKLFSPFFSDIGNKANLFTGVLFNNYNYPEGLCWDSYCRAESIVVSFYNFLNTKCCNFLPL